FTKLHWHNFVIRFNHRGAWNMAPYDLSVPFQSGDIDSFIAMIRSTDGKLLKLHTEEEQNRIIRNAQNPFHL
ncbi:MAG TPA: hypothetical protein DCS54_00950, partial [Oribacterium sp.]|nr:hypothetical protein [Oribacterium sp.]